MLIVSNEDNLGKINEIFDKWDLEYAIIGKTNNSSKYQNIIIINYYILNLLI